MTPKNSKAEKNRETKLIRNSTERQLFGNSEQFNLKVVAMSPELSISAILVQ